MHSARDPGALGGGAALEVTVRGLAGGHSGTEIHKGRANACVLLGRLLQAMAERTELRLVTAAGGGKDNAIAVEAVRPGGGI